MWLDIFRQGKICAIFWRWKLQSLVTISQIIKIWCLFVYNLVRSRIWTIWGSLWIKSYIYCEKANCSTGFNSYNTGYHSIWEFKKCLISKKNCQLCGSWSHWVDILGFSHFHKNGCHSFNSVLILKNDCSNFSSYTQLSATCITNYEK